MALEESQSLLLEMLVGRSRPFVRYLKPLLEKHFGSAGPEWEVDNLYRCSRGAARAHPRRRRRAHLSAARGAALRASRRICSKGELAVRDLPEAWNNGMEQRLGLRPPTTPRACLQDIHWALGSFAYFPSYAVGAAIAAQLHEGLRRDVPTSTSSWRAATSAPGRLAAQNVHGYGAKLTPPEL
jgi:carboxypeptidase Taq